jgi:hypothetical protein
MLVRPTTALIIFKNQAGIPRLITAHEHILEALERRDRAMGRLWVDRHLRDWKAGFERAGMDLDSPVDRVEAMPTGARGSILASLSPPSPARGERAQGLLEPRLSAARAGRRQKRKLR